MKVLKDVKTVSAAINCPVGTLSTIIRENGREFAEGWLMAWLISLNNLLSLRRPMTEDQIELAAFEILEQFPALKISDLSLLSRRIINGYYGEFYESFSISKLVSFFTKYFDERCEVAASESEQQHADQKARFNDFNFTRDVRRLLTTTAKKSR